MVNKIISAPKANNPSPIISKVKLITVSISSISSLKQFIDSPKEVLFSINGLFIIHSSRFLLSNPLIENLWLASTLPPIAIIIDLVNATTKINAIRLRISLFNPPLFSKTSKNLLVIKPGISGNI